MNFLSIFRHKNLPCFYPWRLFLHLGKRSNITSAWIFGLQIGWGVFFSPFLQKSPLKAACSYCCKLLRAGIKLLPTLCQGSFKQLFVKQRRVYFPIASVQKQSFPSLDSWLVKQTRIICFPFGRHDLHSSWPLFCTSVPDWSQPAGTCLRRVKTILLECFSLKPGLNISLPLQHSCLHGLHLVTCSWLILLSTNMSLSLFSSITDKWWGPSQQEVW